MSSNPFIKSVDANPSTGQSKTTFTSGATSDDINCAKFFMAMHDRGYGIEDAKSYANIGPTLSPGIDWNEVNRVIDTFD